MEQDTFQGSVEVQILVTAPTSMIVIHAKQLTFVKAFLRYFETNQETEVILDHSYDEYEYWILKLHKTIETGLYFLGIEYTALYIVYNRGHGLEKLTGDLGKQLIFANTLGAKARSILPCFDEPALKATFDVSVVHPHMDGYYALSNMDVKDVFEEGNSRVTIFKRTPSISPNYLGLTITYIASKSAKVYQEGVGEPYELRIYAGHRLEYVDPFLNLVKETMEFFAQYTNIPYPLPKFDLVAKETFYDDPVTESLGLVVMPKVFRNHAVEPLDIYDERETMSILAGLWFGNLVTPTWWNEYWLTSEFSTFMSWKAIMAFAPNLTETSEYKAYSLIQSAMSFDSYGFRTPLKRTIKKFKSKQDLIDEGKGFGLLMMAESVVGPDNFKKAVSSYLKKHMYGTVTTSDLIEELQDVYSDIHLTNMMISFSTYPNFPIVTLQKLADGSYILKQKIYDEEAALSYNEQVQRYWVIPVTIKTAEKNELIWMKSPEYVIPDLEADWAVISARGFGYYQTNYSENLWLALANVLQEDVEVLDFLERINLLRSVKPEISNLNYDIVFEMVRFLEKETNMLVWEEALVILEDIRSSFKGDALYGFMKYGQNLIRSYYQNISWTKDILEIDHYENVFKFACRCELEDCLVFAETLFKDVSLYRYMTKINRVIAIAGMKKTTDADVWQKYWEAFDADPDFKIYSILMTSKDPEFLNKVLQRAASMGNRGNRVYRTYSEEYTPVDPELVWSLLGKELTKNEITTQFKVYAEILRLGVDPEIFAAICGSSEMEEFAERTRADLSFYLIEAIESAEKMKPAKKWLKENGFGRVIGN